MVVRCRCQTDSSSHPDLPAPLVLSVSWVTAGLHLTVCGYDTRSPRAGASAVTLCQSI